MKTIRISVFLFAIFVIAVKSNPWSPRSRKLVLFLLDGFRWDYFDKPGVEFTGFHRVFARGVKAKYMIPAFPTISYANYYTLMTGLHPESNGMIDNYMYDPIHNESFLLGENPEQFHSHWWNFGDPLWITAKRQGKSTYMYHWPGCEVEIRNLRPDFCIPWSHVPTNEEMKEAISESLNLFESNDLDISAIYTNAVDSAGHVLGPDSPKMAKSLNDVDDMIDFFLTELDHRNLEQDVDVMFLADHGMAELSPSRIIDINQANVIDDCERIISEWSHAQIWPKPGMLDVVYDRLSAFSDNMVVYKKEDMPERWHYRNHYRVPPILMLPDAGWFITEPNRPVIPSNDGSIYGYKGNHGYDNNVVDMRGIFFAMGPSFKEHHVIEPFQNIELYQVMCEIIGITPSPHNGSWANIADAMAVTSSSRACDTSLGVISLASVYFIYVLHTKEN